MQHHFFRARNYEELLWDPAQAMYAATMLDWWQYLSSLHLHINWPEAPLDQGKLAKCQEDILYQLRWREKLYEIWSNLSLQEQQQIKLPEQPYIASDLQQFVHTCQALHQNPREDHTSAGLTTEQSEELQAIRHFHTLEEEYDDLKNLVHQLTNEREINQLSQEILLQLRDHSNKHRRIAAYLQTEKQMSGLHRYTTSVGEQQYPMVFLPVGSFWMGTNRKELHLYDAFPLHSVEMTQPMFMGNNLVSQALYQEVMGENPSHFQAPNHPVEQVNWFDCIQFCNRLSQQAGCESAYLIEPDKVTFLPHTNGYRLPTEAQWEYAACCGLPSGPRKHLEFKNGFVTKRNLGALGSLHEVAWYEANSQGQTQPIGQKRSNEWGIFDLSGNVFEWCTDNYQADYYPSSPAKDPYCDTGPYRVIRGGAWNYKAEYQQVIRRSFWSPGSHSPSIGFRVVRPSW